METEVWGGVEGRGQDLWALVLKCRPHLVPQSGQSMLKVKLRAGYVQNRMPHSPLGLRPSIGQVHPLGLLLEIGDTLGVHYSSANPAIYSDGNPV